MPPLTPRLRAALTVALSLAVFMNILDLSIANVAIPTIAGDLGVSADNGTYVITSFAVSAAIAMPLTGWLARRFGELRTFLVCTASFTVASLLCGLAPDLALLIAMRAAQGLVAGPMIPLAQSLLLANYPDDRKNLALALIMMVTVAAPVLGPVLGGWLTDNWSWGWVFYVNVPVGIIATLATAWLLRGRETRIERVPPDVVGIGLLAIGVGSLQIMLDRGKDLDWFGSPTIVALAVVALAGLAFFVAWELTDERPAVDLRLFAGRNFAVGTIVICIGYAVYFGNIVLLPLWLQTQMGYTATLAGLATAPLGILPIFLAPFIGRYMGRIDLRWWVTLSFLAFASSSFWFAGFNTDVTFREIAWSRFAQGVGVACFFAPLNAIVIAGIPPNRVAAATGLAFTLRTLAGSFATSLTTTWWDRREALHQAHLTERVTALDPAVRGALDQLHALAMRGDTAFALIERSLVQQAYMLGTNDMFWLWGWMLLALVALTWFTRPPFVAGRIAAAGE
jgi:DHA2 family multidrug resistance protein